MRREQSAVVLGDAVRLVAEVDEAKQVLEVLPAGIGDGVKPGHLVGRAGSMFSGSRVAVFAKGDEHDAVEQPLGHFDRLVERMVQLEVEIGNQLGAVDGIGVVELVADLALAVRSILSSKSDGAGRLAGVASIKPLR